MSGRYYVGQAVEHRLAQPDEAAGPVVYEVRMVSIGHTYVAYGLSRRGNREIVKMARHEALVPHAARPDSQPPTGEEPEACCDG